MTGHRPERRDRSRLFDLDSGKSVLVLYLLAIGVVGALVVVLMAVFGDVPTRGGEPGARKTVPGLPFVLLLVVGIAAAVSLIRAWRGRSARTRDGSSDPPAPGEAGGTVTPLHRPR